MFSPGGQYQRLALIRGKNEGECREGGGGFRRTGQVVGQVVDTAALARSDAMNALPAMTKHTIWPCTVQQANRVSGRQCPANCARKIAKCSRA